MLEFKKITFADGALLSPKLRGLDCNLLNYNFVVQYIYRNVIDFQYALADDFLFLKVHSDNGQEQFLMPVGDKQHLNNALYRLKMYAFSHNDSFTITQFCEINAQYLLDWIDKCMETEALNYEFYPVRDEFEYMYRSQDLVKLEGHILKPKRNRVNAFHRSYRGTIEAITPDNISEVMHFSKQWADIKFEQPKMERLNIEVGALQESLRHFFELDLQGIILRADGVLAAFSLGCPLNEETFLVLFEEGNTNFTGTYNVVNQEFAKIISEKYTYINRSEDCGVEGLRRAKLAYNPSFLNKIHHLDIYKTNK
jgi:hypothetical protein